MIIRSVRAHNFMRFKRISLGGLPERGLIGIEGPNESGKSTVGELLFFGLFGCSRNSQRGAVTDLIRWGADALTVEIAFSVCGPGSDPGGEPREYVIYREIDRAGTNYVKIVSLPGRDDVATGCLEVRDFLALEVGFDAEELCASFYHDQHDTHRLQRDQVDYFERVSGVVHLRDAMERLRETIVASEGEFLQLERELNRQRCQIDRHEKNVEKLPALGEKLDEAKRRVSEADSQLERRRKEQDALRAEATGLDARCKGVDATRRGTVLAFAGRLEELVRDDEKSSRERVDLRSNERFGRALTESSERLGQLAAASEGLRQLIDAARERSSELGREIGELGEIAEETAPGAPGAPGAPTSADAGSARAPVGVRAEIVALDRDATRLRSSRARTRGLAGFAAFILIAAGGGALAFQRGALELPLPPAQVYGAAGGVGALALLLLIVALAAAGSAGGKLRAVGSTLDALRERVRRARAARAVLEAASDSTVASAGDVVESLQQSGDEVLADRARQLVAAHATHFPTNGAGAEGGGMATAAEALVRSDRALRQKLNDAAKKTQKRGSDRAQERQKLLADRDRVEAEVRECTSHRERAEGLRTQVAALGEEAAKQRGSIDAHHGAIRLLEGTITRMRSRLAPSLRAQLRSLVPPLTADRYRDVKVDANLELSLFSSDKGDFLTLSELSGGTGEALSLAVRLALAQAFVDARLHQRQFLFLDEPFKMMDAERSDKTLAALASLSSDLSQVFVAQPRFTVASRDRIDYLLETSLEPELLAGALTRPEAGPRAPRAVESAARVLTEPGALAPMTPPILPQPTDDEDRGDEDRGADPGTCEESAVDAESR